MHQTIDLRVVYIIVNDNRGAEWIQLSSDHVNLKYMKKIPVIDDEPEILELVEIIFSKKASRWSQYKSGRI